MTPDEVQYLISAPNAITGYSLPGTVYNSNGNYASTTQYDLAVAQNNIFPDITGPQNANQQVDYQCVFVYNSDGADSMSNTVAWIPTTSITSYAVTWGIAADPIGPTTYTYGDQQAQLIANPYVAPAGIYTWTPPSPAVAGGISLGTIGPRQVYAVWIKRSATGTPDMNVGFNLQVTFDV